MSVEDRIQSEDSEVEVEGDSSSQRAFPDVGQKLACVVHRVIVDPKLLKTKKDTI